MPPLRAAVLAAVALALAGCGGEEPPPPDPVAEYRERVTTVCAGAVAEMEDALASGATFAELQRMTERTFEQILAVRPPPALATAHEDLRRAGRAAMAIGKAGRANPGPEPRLQRRFDEEVRRAEAALRRLGLDGCLG